MMRPDLLQNWIADNFPVGHRVICRKTKSRTPDRVQDDGLINVGMVFHLIGYERTGAKREGLGKQGGRVVAQADMANLASLARLIQSADLIGQRNIVVRPVKEEKVDIVGPAVLEAFMDRCVKFFA